MQITSENGFQNAFIYKKLWQKEVTDQNQGHFLCILSPFWVKNVVSRGNLSRCISELINNSLLSGTVHVNNFLLTGIVLPIIPY